MLFIINTYMSQTLIYEQALYSDQFLNDIQCGKYSDTRLQHMLDNNQLNSYQIQVVRENAPNVQQPQQPVQQPQQQTLPAQQPAKAAPTNGTWTSVVQAVKQSKLIPLLNKLKTEQVNDQYITQAATYIVQVLVELNTHIKNKGAQQAKAPTPNVQPQSAPVTSPNR